MAASDSSGWYGLLAIIKEGQLMREEEASRPPIACPNDGEPLMTAPDGSLFCRFDGWSPGS